MDDVATEVEYHEDKFFLVIAELECRAKTIKIQQKLN